MKFLILINFLFFLCCCAFAHEAKINNINVICHCVNDCDRAKKCEWIYGEFLSMEKNIQNNFLQEDVVKVLAQQNLSFVEIVDSGGYGCFSTFGSVGKNFVRVDVELEKKKNIFVDAAKVSDLKDLPSLESRKNVKAEGLCTFVDY